MMGGYGCELGTMREMYSWVYREDLRVFESCGLSFKNDDPYSVRAAIYTGVD